MFSVCVLEFGLLYNDVKKKIIWLALVFIKSFFIFIIIYYLKPKEVSIKYFKNKPWKNILLSY